MMEAMDYESFKKELLGRLERHYGGSVEVRMARMEKNNGMDYDGILIRRPGERVCPVLRAEQLYEAYAGGTAGMDDCVRAALAKRTEQESTEGMERFAAGVLDWDRVKGQVYPALLSAEANRGQMGKLASMPFLDLMVVYVVRESAGGGYGVIKINKDMLEWYGITTGQLHEQAMGNLQEDGYRFFDLREALAGQGETADGMEMDSVETPLEGAYILTNSNYVYGAAGILDGELVREFAAGRDFFILPSSVHETLFVPVQNRADKKWLDALVNVVNRTEIEVENRLSDHCYFYDGENGEIKMYI